MPNNTNSRIGKTRPVLPWKSKSIFRTRQDIQSWNIALQYARKAEDPANWKLQLLYDEITVDAHLSSQILNRKNQLFNMDIVLKNENDEVDEKQTKRLINMPLYRKMINAILDKVYYGYSLIEIIAQDDGYDIVNIPRTNVIPQTGVFYPDYTDETKKIFYREMVEYGKWILEFYDEDIGILNKVVPHVLFKRFAQSCWSELCEIYGIPPRVMKTNTADPTMLKRAENMMRDMGAAAWFIIDETEKFEWAETSATNGDVYANLMNVCRNEISLIISGAVIGQDTKHGNESKEKSSQEILWELVKSDAMMVEQEMNDTVIPALKSLGIITDEVHFEFMPVQDLEALWKTTHEALQYYKIDPEWVKEKFGIEVTGEREQANPFGSDSLNYAPDFFG